MRIIRGMIVRVAIPVVTSCLIGLCSAVISGIIFNERIDARVSHLEHEIQKYNDSFTREVERQSKMIQNNSTHMEDHERRITRLETLMDSVNVTVSEIRTDVKQLLREVK